MLFATGYSDATAHRFFTYPADGKVTPDDNKAATEFVGAFETFTQSSGSPLQMDVTQWTRTNSTGYIGFKVQTDPVPGATGPAGLFKDLNLAFFSKANDVPLHFEWLNFPTNRTHPAANPLTIQLELYDPDSRVTSVRVLDSFSRDVIATAAPDLPPGTNFLSLDLTNLSPGFHSFVIEGVIENGSVTNAYRAIDIYATDDPPHRWFGSGGNSSSFYVVDASGRAWVWGDNTSGQLGLGFKGGIVTRPTMVPPPQGKRWRRFTSNSYCAVGLTDDGLIYGMGENADASLSMFKTENPTLPMPLPMLGEIHISGAALTESGLLTVGARGTLRANFGAQVSAGRPIKLVEAGAGRVVAIDDAGALYYGRPDFGNFAPDTSQSGATLPWLRASACETHWLALDSAGQLFGWGLNTSGQLPFSSASVAASPIKAKFASDASTWTMVEAGKNVSLAVDGNGKLYSWGKPGYIGSTEPFTLSKIVPVAVASDETGWLDLAVGSTFAMALSAKGNLYVWGDIPALPVPRHVELPELVSGLPDLLNPNETSVTAVTFEPQSIHLGTELQIDLIAAQSSSLILESSPDLVTWLTVTNVSVPSGKTRLTIPVSTTDRMFVRVKP